MVNSVNDGTRFGNMMSNTIYGITGCYPKRHGTLEVYELSSEERMRAIDSNNRSFEMTRNAVEELKILEVIKTKISEEIKNIRR